MSDMTPTRIVVTVSSRSQHWAQASQSPETLGQIALDILKNKAFLQNNTIPRFVAEEKYINRTRLVFDIFHDDYRPENGHLPGQGDLPILLVRLSKEESAEIASAYIRQMVNGKIRDLHDWTGLGSVPPFLLDYSTGQTPTFWNPRTMKKAPTGQTTTPSSVDTGSLPDTGESGR